MTRLPEHVFVVVLAGGSGTRFWPKSRHQTPKQLCAIGDAKRTMLEQTLDRLNGTVPRERILIVTHQDQLPGTAALVGERVAGILAEPEARNTANALGLAALEVEAMARARGIPEPVMISLHADHVIANVPAFLADLNSAVTIAEQGFLTLLGIRPRYPETGFGYIERGEAMAAANVKSAYRVQSFREKPAIDLAKEYVACGKFYWNAGLFVWRNALFLEELTKRLPASVELLRQIIRGPSGSLIDAEAASMQSVYRQLPKISIDHAVLETSDRVAVLETDFGWQDVGSWDALSQCFPTDDAGNLLYGDIFSLDCQNSTIDSDGPFVAAIGLQDMVVVAARGAMLICPKSRAQDVKEIVAHLKEQKRTELI